MREHQETAQHRFWHLNTSIKGTQGLVTSKERKQSQVSSFFLGQHSIMERHQFGGFRELRQPPATT